MSTNRPRNFSVTLSADDVAFLKQLKGRRGGSAAAVVRTLIRGAKDLYELPPYQAARLRQDMEHRGLDVVEYLQEALALRYERLSREAEAETPRSHNGKGSHR